MWSYNDQVQGYEYDPQRARQLLAEAGLSDGFETELWAMPVPCPYMPQPDKIAQAIQADLGKIGVRAKILQWEWGTYLDKVSQGEHTMALLGWTGDNGDPDNFLYVLLDKTAAEKPAGNIAFYRSEQSINLGARASKRAAGRARRSLSTGARNYFSRCPLGPPVHATQTAAFRHNVEGFKLHPTGNKWFRNVRINTP